MPKTHTIHIRETVDAPIERVFERFADHQWFVGLFGGSCERVVEGEGEQNGLGSVRRIGPGPLSFDETIVVFEPHARIHYKITRGGVLNNHLGEITFEARDGGTTVDYRIRFEGKAPLVGALVKRALKAQWKRNSGEQLRAL